jgi:hypothetical protein
MKKRKFKRFNGEDESSVTADDLEAANNSEDAIATLNARKGWTGSEEAAAPVAASKPKQRVISKAELEKSGLSLRDFMNREQGLTRRGGEPAAKASSAKTTAPATQSAPAYSNEGRTAPKPAMRQETMRDRAESYVAKQAARKAEEAAADANSDKNRQSRILTGIKKKADENKFMGSTGLKSGGPVFRASANGIAQRGKTRGKIC